MKPRAPRNRTLALSDKDRKRLTSRVSLGLPHASTDHPPLGTVLGDCLRLASALPPGFVDLMILDPPYNLNKTFRERKFTRRSIPEYTAWLDQVITALKPVLKPTSSVYICGDWHSSASILETASRHFVVRNRITWEREKGRGAKTNWKNAAEDIWFCTVSDRFVFNLDQVKLRRKVVAPYRKTDGSPKDWQATDNGNYRDTHPSNLWTDITIPFWSMPENTDHPTQKSEKLIARLVLASSNPGDVVFDPFLGSGTTSVVAKKLRRKYLGIEIDEEYCMLAERRLELAEQDGSIQGYTDEVFWERNTLAEQVKNGGASKKKTDRP